MAITMKITVFWHMKPCSFTDIKNILEEHAVFISRVPENLGSTLVRNVSYFLHNNASHPGQVFVGFKDVWMLHNSPGQWLLSEWMALCTLLQANGHCMLRSGTSGGICQWRGTALQVGRSRVRFPMVSLEFFVGIILPAALWPWGRLSLWQK